MTSRDKIRKSLPLAISALMILSLALTMATAPVSASELKTWIVRPITLQSVDGGEAIWSAESYAGENSVKLSSGTAAGTSLGRAVISVDITLDNIENISFWYYIDNTKSQVPNLFNTWPVYEQEGFTYDDNGYLSPYIVLEITDGTTEHWIISQPFGRDPDSGWTPAWENWDMTDNAPEYPLGSEMDPTEALWHNESFTDNAGTGGGGAYPAGWEYLSFFQNTYDGYTVTKVKVVMGGWDITTNQGAYVDDLTVNGFTYELEEPDFSTIQAAINAAGTGDTVLVYLGAYYEALTVNVENLTIKSSAGADNTIIAPTSANLAGFNVTASGATIGGDGSGFTIGAGGRGGIYADVNGGKRITVQGNIFKSYATNESRGMWFENLSNGALITGNSFTTPILGTGIQVVNADGATISNNTVATGTLKYCFLTFKAEAFYPARDPPNPYAEYAAESASTINNVTVTGNEIAGMAANRHAIRFAASTKVTTHGTPYAQDLTVGAGGVVISGNVFENNGIGVQIDENKTSDEQTAHIYGVENIAINNNNFEGNTLAVNNGQATTLDATLNWWGDSSGPSGEGSGEGDAVSTNVNYNPWLLKLKDEPQTYYDYTLALESGWNLISTPKILENDNIAEMVADIDDIQHVYRYEDSSWLTDSAAYGQESLYASFVKVKEDAGSIGIGFKWTTDMQAVPPARVLPENWSLIGPNMDPSVETSVRADYFLDSVTGSYSTLFSPNFNLNNWTVTTGTANGESVLPYEGYWIFMKVQDTLAGRTT